MLVAPVGYEGRANISANLDKSKYNLLISDLE